MMELYEFVSWGYDIPNIWKVMKAMFQTTNQLYFDGWLDNYSSSSILIYV